MKERHILIGNGINIAFSNNNDYKNYSIIERLIKYLETDRYNDVFQGSITSEELLKVLSTLNEHLKEMLKGVSFIKRTQNEDELETLVDIARRYNNSEKNLIDIGIEDYFFVMKMLFNQYGDDKTSIKALYDGLKILFLDAIFNDGKVETLYKKMDLYIDELKQYDKIFTVNYDTNLDKLTDKKVYHLHGSFDVLDDTYRPDTVIGCLAQKKVNPPVVIRDKKHLYCNAIMAFSGKRKMDIMNIYRYSNLMLDEFMPRLKNPLDSEAQLFYKKLKNSKIETDKQIYETFNMCLNNPMLRNTEYPIYELNNIKGELHILGMSPNNDVHIFDMINNNQNITNVVYFSASSEDTQAAQKVIKKPIQIRDVFKYWKELGLQGF